jgi:signal peptidase I
MGLLTGALYACLIVYLGGWYVGQWHGNFSLLLFVLTVVTLVYWLAERFRFKPARVRAAAALEANDTRRRAELASRASTRSTAMSPRPSSRSSQPGGSTGRRGLAVICAVFLLRSFLFSPKIPSASMVPTLLVGD